MAAAIAPAVAFLKAADEQANTSGSGLRSASHPATAGARVHPAPVRSWRPRPGGGAATARFPRGAGANVSSLSAYGHRHQITGSWAEDSFDEWAELGGVQFQSLPETTSRRRVANTRTSTSSCGRSGGRRDAARKGYQPRSSASAPGHHPVSWERSQEPADPNSARRPSFEDEAETTSRTPFPDPSSSSSCTAQARDVADRQSRRARQEGSASNDSFANDEPSGSLPPLANGIEPWSPGPSVRAPASLALVSCKGPAKGLYDGLKEVFVILFGVGEEGHEGIYSLRAIDRDDGLPHDTIIAFEDQRDAERYAAQLDGTFRAFSHLPSVCSIPPEELLDFCVDAGYNCRLEPAGSHLLPPDFNVGTTDWERSLRLRNGNFSVLEHEPQVIEKGNFSDDTLKFGGLTELDRQKLQLERLLLEMGPESSDM